MRVMRRGQDDEQGAVVIIVVLCLLAIFGMVVLTVDGGGLLARRRQMVTAADAAALAAAIDCAGDGGDPAGQADSLATANVSSATRTAGPVIEPAGACGSAEGQVTLTYQSVKDLTFAPIIGLSQTADVPATATALWGPAGSSNPVPVMVRSGWLRDCDLKNAEIGDECNFWLNDNELGGALWAWMNLDEWNVAPAATCPNAGANERDEWIRHGYPTSLALNYPDPTYVCTTTGHASTNWQDLFDEIGVIKFFPVNDETKQVDKNGNVCAPPCKPDKYDVIAFVPLKIAEVLRGNDDAAVGTSGGSGSCNPTHNFTLLPPNNEWDLDTQACRLDNLSYPADPSKPYPKLSKGSTTYVHNTDYQYDASTHVITWLQANQSNVRVEWGWTTPATPGKCGVHPKDPNAICLVTTWQGPQEGGGDPGGGGDFGLRGVRLSK